MVDNTSKPWVIIQCTSGQEANAERRLDRMGYPHGWHPTHKERIPEAVYQRRLKAAKKLPSFAQSRMPKRYKVKTTVTGYVFLPASEITVHQINGHHGPNLWLEVLCVNGEPYRVSDDVMAGMKDMPETLRALVDEAQRARQAAWEAKRPIVGKQARVMRGIFEGHEGAVISVGDEVEMDVGAFVGHVKVPHMDVERV